MRGFAGAALAVLLACGPNSAGIGGSGGSGAGGGAAGGAGGAGGGTAAGTGGNAEGCPEGAKTVYVVSIFIAAWSSRSTFSMHPSRSA